MHGHMNVKFVFLRISNVFYVFGSVFMWLPNKFFVTHAIRQTGIPAFPACWVTNTHSVKNAVSTDIMLRLIFMFVPCINSIKALL